MARERRVVTPDGRVWFVRRRWARRRPPWARRSRQPMTRVDADEELPAETWVNPPIGALFTYPDGDLGEGGFDRLLDDQYAAGCLLGAVIIGVLVTGLGAAATVEFVLPWLLPWVAANAGLLLGAAVAVAVLVVVDRRGGPGSWSSSAKASPTRRGGSGACGMAAQRAPDGGDRRRRPRGPDRQRARRGPVPPRRSAYRRPRRRLRKNRMTRTMMMISSSVVSRMGPPRCRACLPGCPGA